MNDGVFDPSDVKAAPMKLLGEVYQLADIKRSDQHRLNTVNERIQALPDENPTPEQNDEAAHLMCEFIAVMVEGDTGEVTTKLQAAYDADELGVGFLQRAQQHCATHMGLQEEAGNA